jgi:hypothetical protein
MDFGLVIALPDAAQTRTGTPTLQVWKIFAMRVFKTKKAGPSGLALLVHNFWEVKGWPALYSMLHSPT